MRKLGELHCPIRDMAYIMGVDDEVLTRFPGFYETYEAGKATMRKRLRNRMIQVALEGNVQMLIWLSKNMLDMSEPVRITGESRGILVPLDSPNSPRSP